MLRRTRSLEKWYQDLKEEREMEKIIQIYEAEYKGKESREEIALLKLLKDIKTDITKPVEVELERRGFIITKEGKRYWTTRGLEVANAIIGFDKLVKSRK